MNYYVGKIVSVDYGWRVKLKILRVDAFGFLFEVMDRDSRYSRESIYYQIGNKIFIPHDKMPAFKILD